MSEQIGSAVDYQSKVNELMKADRYLVETLKSLQKIYNQTDLALTHAINLNDGNVGFLRAKLALLDDYAKLFIRERDEIANQIGSPGELASTDFNEIRDISRNIINWCDTQCNMCKAGRGPGRLYTWEWEPTATTITTEFSGSGSRTVITGR